jgi:hypothetical protein
MGWVGVLGMNLIILMLLDAVSISDAFFWTHPMKYAR